MPHCVGLDVSQKTTAICVVDEQGGRPWRGVCATDPGAISARISKYAGIDTKVGIETGAMTPWLVHAGLRRGLSQTSGVDGSSGMAASLVAENRDNLHDPECDCRAAEASVQGRLQGPPLRASLILQAVSWYLRYPLSYRDIEELFRGARPGGGPRHPEPLGPGLRAADRAPVAGVPQAALRVNSHRRDLLKIRGQWRYLYRAIDKHGTPVDFLLTATRDLKAAKRFFRKMLKDQPLLAPDRIGTDGAGPPPAITAARKDGLLPHDPLHYVTKHLRQGIESDLPGQEAHAADRRLSILPHGTTDDPGVRGHAMAARGL